MMPKSIVFIITNNLSLENDGVSDYSVNLYHELTHKNFNPKLISLKKLQETSFYINQDIIDLNIDNWNFNGCFQLLKTIRKYKPSWLFVQYVPYSFSKTGLPFTFTFILILSRLFGTKILVNFHEIGIRFTNNGIISIPRAFLQRVISYLLCCSSNSILTSNVYYAKMLLPFKSKIIPIPSNFENLLNKTLVELKQKKYPIIITTSANRSNESFFKIISQLHLNYVNDFVVNITGRADKNDLTRIDMLTTKYNLQKCIKYHVNLPDNEYCLALANTHYFVNIEFVSNKGEGGVSTKSGVIASAMALGLPIISTCGDLTDLNIFKHNENIFFVPFNNPILAAAEIQNLINNIPLRNNLIKHSKLTYYSKMQWSESIKFYSDILS
ncbi:MAG: glycosyltransferase [Bacteroidota bacterium]